MKIKFYILVLKFLDAILYVTSHGTGEHSRNLYKTLHKQGFDLVEELHAAKGPEIE